MVDYDTMKAGPQLDRLVAEKVMGWSFHKYKNEDPDHVGYFTYEIPDHPFQKHQKFDWRDLPLLSKDIGGAWQVVEHLRQQRFYVALDEYENIFTFSFHRENTDGALTWFDAAWASAPTLPLAICHAALKAVEARTDVGKDAG